MDGPEIQIIPGQPSAQGYVSSISKIVLSASDASGVDNIYYNVDSGTWQTYAGPFYLSVEGAHTVHAYARDIMGNTGQTITQELNVDDTPPVVYVLGAVDNAITVNRGDNISMMVSDSGVSVCTIEYSQDGGSTWVEYMSTGITVENDMTLIYYAQDALGNSCPEQTLAIKINSSDNKMLYLEIGFTFAAIGTVLLIYINRPGVDSPEKLPEKKDDPKPERKKKNRRH